jgi:hypothetical protein
MRTRYLDCQLEAEEHVISTHSGIISAGLKETLTTGISSARSANPELPLHLLPFSLNTVIISTLIVIEIGIIPSFSTDVIECVYVCAPSAKPFQADEQKDDRDCTVVSCLTRRIRW